MNASYNWQPEEEDEFEDFEDAEYFEDEDAEEVEDEAPFDREGFERATFGRTLTEPDRERLGQSIELHEHVGDAVAAAGIKRWSDMKSFEVDRVMAQRAVEMDATPADDVFDVYSTNRFRAESEWARMKLAELADPEAEFVDVDENGNEVAEG